MFGSRSGSPYGAFGLINAPNGSAGDGSQITGNSSVPTPSGYNLLQPSVYNKGIDYEASTVPSTFVLPSSHPELVGGQNEITEGDFLFVLRDTGATGCGGESYETRYSRVGKTETTVVTIQKINELLRSCALKDHHSMTSKVAWKSVHELNDNRMWWMNPDCVSNWAVPFGVALNSMKLKHSSIPGGGMGHNIVVSRRANVKNNFFTVKGDRAESWHTQSMRHLAVQYNVESVILHDAGEPFPVVQLSMLLIDDYDRIRGRTNLSPEWFDACDAGHSGVARSSCNGLKSEVTTESTTSQLVGSQIRSVAGCLTINSVLAHNPRPEETSYGLFAERPLGNPGSRVVVPIGRVLHSAPRCPTAADCLRSCHVKSVYDRMAPVEIEIGCH
jgi:hypothetical protein